eukprot:CAMPEP_0170644278 /NCGR_PEP_ID=MMETSP0224-20130122/42383_1 /TAXON_ID=285029 /ORGANISM="Togula jolla, Strain CCCM 725" /LENGTH=36 /DNA_ID= /DNA_START= /DNA_END= /DNA_ORIENTATION=
MDLLPTESLNESLLPLQAQRKTAQSPVSAPSTGMSE